MSLNDPQWGKRGNQNGPPDLDEIWRNFNRKLNDAFGRSGDGGGSGGGNAGVPAAGLGILLGLVSVIWLASGFYIVDPSQRGVVFRFGKYVETTQSGPRWHLPYPIETVELVNQTHVRTIEIGRGSQKKTSLMLTEDENIVDIQFAVQYDVRNPEDYLFNNRHNEDAVAQVAETSMREVIGKSKMDNVLYGGREKIAIDAQLLMQEILDRYKSGIQVKRVTLQNAQPPEQVQAAFDDAVKASQDRERQKNEGEAYANDVVPKARGQRARQLEDAQGYARAVVAEAEGNASRFKQILVEYNKAPAVTRDRLYLDMMQSVLGNTTKVLVDQKGSNNLVYLPLDKIIQNAPATAPDAAKGAAVTTVEPTTTVTLDSQGRSRESLRSRERESR